MRRRLCSWVAAALTVGALLACSGVGTLPGVEVARTEVRTGDPIDLVFEGTGHPLDLWVTYEIEQDRADFTLHGDLKYAIQGGERGSVPVRLGPDDRLPDSKGHWWGTAQLGRLPAVPAGQRVRIRGALEVGNVTSYDVDLVVLR